jgi:23S rRNA (cytidine1920-2'-O)/16S rRNA (cytidine1409-2'-O)-methyltransferase
VVKDWFGDQPGKIIGLIKPQFEAGREEVSKGDGVIHDPRVHRQVLEEVLTFAQEVGFGVQGLLKSSLKGPKGNIEFLVYLKWPGTGSVYDHGLILHALNSQKGENGKTD